MSTAKWTPRDAVIKVDDASDITITTSAALDTFFSSGVSIESYAKNLTITPPEGDVEHVPLIGDDTNGIQNEAGDEKPFGMASVSGTLVHQKDEVLEPFAAKNGSVAVSTTHTRWQIAKGARNQVAILVNFDDATKEVNVVLDNAWITRIGAKTLNADGHFEQEFEIKCLAGDYYEEIKN